MSFELGPIQRAAAMLFLSVACHAGCSVHPRDPEPARRWMTLLRNHREAIAAMDFFSVPTMTCSVLYCFFIIGHESATHPPLQRHAPSDERLDRAAVARSFSLPTGNRFLILDHDSKYGTEVPAAIRSMDITPIGTRVSFPIR